MRGLILAAGFGTRLRPLTENLPKVLVPVAGKPLLERTLELFAAQGFGPMAVNTHYRHEAVASYAQHSHVPFEISHEIDRIRGTGGGIYHARDFLGQQEEFLVANAEPVRQLDVRSLAVEFRRSGAACGLVSLPVSGNGTIWGAPESGEYMGTRDDDLRGREKRAYCYLGIAFYRRAFLDLLSEGDFSVVPVWRRAQAAGLQVRIVAAPASAYWRDVGTPAELAQVHFDVLNGEAPWSAPSHMVMDTDRPAVYPTTLPKERIDCIGKLVWCEVADVPRSTLLERTVVLRGAALEDGRCYRECIVTPWGVMHYA